MEYHTELMSSEAIERYWPYIEEQLDLVPQVWYPYFTKEDIRVRATEQGGFVWGTGTQSELKLVVFGRIVEAVGGRMLQLFLAIGNDLDNCMPSLLGAIEKIANDAGCIWCEIYGRPGWEKKLEGFERTAVVLRKSLKPFTVQ